MQLYQADQSWPSSISPVVLFLVCNYHSNLTALLEYSLIAKQGIRKLASVTTLLSTGKHPEEGLLGNHLASCAIIGGREGGNVSPHDSSSVC